MKKNSPWYCQGLGIYITRMQDLLTREWIYMSNNILGAYKHYYGGDV
jgi:hypothetical protein